MFRPNSVLTLLVGVLIAFVSPTVAEENDCPQVQTSKCPAQGQTEVDKDYDDVPIRQKPYGEYDRLGNIERDLPPVDLKEHQRSINAAEAIMEFTPKDMIRDARAIAVIPGMKKGALAFGARWGKGLLSARDENGVWLPPSYVEITGGNFGLQAGFQSTDLILIFTNADAVNALLRGKLTLNADASAAAGPWGRKAQVGVPLLVNSGIYAFSKSKGLYAGVSLDGATITIDDTSNHRVYGMNATGDAILADHRVAPNEAVAPFLNALETVAPPPTKTAEGAVD